MKTKEYDITALGELLMDFTATGPNSYEVNPGGAPANLICVPAKYGLKTAFIGKVGADAFGQQLLHTLQQQGVDTSGIVSDANVFTTLAFVDLDQRGNPSFSFARSPGADTMLSSIELPIDILESTKILHISSLALTSEPTRSAAAAAIKVARNAGAVITFDVNYRPNVWPNEDTARKWLLQGIKDADIVKLSREELSFLGVEPMEMLHTYSSHFIFITMGSDGCRYVGRDGEGFVQGIRIEEVIDTTGAGDIFFGAALYQLLQTGKEAKELTHNDLVSILRFANEKGAASILKKGGIPSIPEL